MRGYGMIQTGNAAKPLSSICLMPLRLDRFETALAAASEDAGVKAGTIQSDPPQNMRQSQVRGASCGLSYLPHSRCGIAVYSAPWGRSRRSWIPAGRLGKAPFPLALHRVAIGPRPKQGGHASPLGS